MSASSAPTAGTAHGAAPETAAAAAEAVPVDDLGIDRGALAALQEDVGGAASLARIIRLFLDQLDPQAEQIRQAASAGEHETVARTAHRMKSSSATLGATTLAEVLELIESAANDGDAAQTDGLAASLQPAVENARSAFEGVMEGLEAAN